MSFRRFKLWCDSFDYVVFGWYWRCRFLENREEGTAKDCRNNLVYFRVF
jgi:hypothetical protein